MIVGALLLVVANAAVFLGARVLLEKVQTGRGDVDFLAFLLLRLLLISAVVLCAGTFGLLTSAVLGSAGVAALLLLLFAGGSRHLRLPRLPEFGWPLWSAVGVVAIRLAAQAWFFVPYNFDALSYHLTKVGEWIRAGGFTPEMGLDTHASFPAGFELIEAWWVVFLRHDGFIELAGIEFLALAFAAVYALAGAAQVSPKGCFLAAFLYVLVPGVNLGATSCLNDVPVAALVIAAAALLSARAPLGLVLLSVGLGIGVKPTFAYLLPGLLVLAILVRHAPKLPSASLRWSVFVSLVALAAGSYWYVRNFAWYGNPIHPVGTRGLIGGTGELKIQFGPSLSSWSRNLADLIDARLYDAATPYGGLLVHISGWGAAAFSCGFVALVDGLRKDVFVRRLAVGFILSLLSLFALVNHDPWYLRFALFFPALLMVAVARMAERTREILYVAGAAALCQFAATMVPVDLDLNSVRRLAASSWRTRSTAQLMDAEQPESAVGYYLYEPVHGRGESYVLYRPDYSCRVVYLRPKTAVDLVAEMKQRDVRCVYVPRTHFGNDPILRDCVRNGLLVPGPGRFYFRNPERDP